MSQWTSEFYIHSVHSDRDVEIDFRETIGGTLNFHNFLRELVFQAIHKGTKVIISEEVSEPIIDGDFVCGVKTVKGSEIKSKITIDCSGPSAVIAKNIGLYPERKDTKIGIGLEYELFNYKIRNQNSIDLYVGRDEIIPVGYGWVFPTGENRAKIGIATVFNTGEKVEKNIKYYHNRFLNSDSHIYGRIKNAQPFEMHMGAYSLNGILEKPYANGLMVAGDAASQASPLLGEGIRYALEFGKNAAETAYSAIRNNNVTEDYLKQYKEGISEYLGEKFKIAEDLLNVPTNEYWESLIDSLTALENSGERELILKYLQTDMNRRDAMKIFPSFEGKYL